MIRTLLPILIGFSAVGATVPDHPLYFEERSSGVFEAAGQSAIILADRLEMNGVTLRFVHPSRQARVEGFGTPAPSTYITRDGTVSFRAYPKAGIRHLYPGIDVSFYGKLGHLEYDLDLARGAKPDRIRIGVSGAHGIQLDEQGNLILDAQSGQLRQLAPRVFQTTRGVRREISAHYVRLSPNEFGFRLGKHDRTIPLTIDPVIVYAKYFGGSVSNSGGPVATDAQGNVYVTGSTNSSDFPSTNGTKSRLQPPLLAYTNAGQTVTPLPVGTATSVTAIGGTSDGNVLYVASPGGIYYSGNHGASFTQAAPLMNSSGNVAGMVLAISVDAIDPSRAFVATPQGLFSLNANGQSAGEDDPGMASTGNGTVSTLNVQISAVNHEVMYATTAFPSNFLYTSTDAGSSWQQLYPSYPGEAPAGQYRGTIVFTLAPGGSDLYVIDGNGVLFKTTDGGMTWQKISGHYISEPKSITIDPNNQSNIYVVDAVGIEESTDGGNTFTTITPVALSDNSVQSFAIDSSTGNLYLASYTNIEVSVDQGVTWKILAPRLNPHVLIGLGNQVFAGVDSPSVPFVTKWSPDGSQLLYSTFFGGSFSDAITAITVDAQGEATIAGDTASSDFPVSENISAASPSGLDSGFVAKLSADGSQAIYSSVIGASLGVTVNSVAIDATGAPYITGTTPSPDFPTTAGVPQTKLPTAMCQRTNTNPFLLDGNLGTYAFVSKLSANASSLVYSTFLTGACGSIGQGIAVDSAGEAMVVGFTTSPDFPVTTGAYQTNFPGGDAASITYPNPFNIGFVTKLSAAGDKAIASSFIGGGFLTEANAVALDTSGDPYITGSTWGITPGATPGVYQTMVKTGCPPVVSIGPGIEYPTGGSDVFVLKLNPTLSSAQYLTYLGGICDDSGNSIVLEPNGNVWVAGYPSQDFPLVTPYELSGGGSNFVSELSADFSQLLFSSFSDGVNLAVDPNGEIYVSGASGGKASLVKIDPTGAPPVIVDSIATNSAPSPLIAAYVAPGELINIGGQNLGPSNTVMAQLDATGHLPFVVGATSVSFGEYSAPLISIQDNLIVCFVPFEVSGPTQLTVKVDGQSSNSVLIGTSPSAPYVLEVINQDGSMNSATHPAPQGSVVMMYLTGLGVTSPLSQDGSISAPPLPVPASGVSVYFNSNQLQPQFVGAADGLIAGITQVNVQIPVGTYSSNPTGINVNGAFAQIYIVQ
jgi:uncharacterized protein (TIGR03437 family)